MLDPRPQRALTVVAEILSAEHKRTLRELLESIGSDIQRNGRITFSDLETVHFMRWTIIDEEPEAGSTRRLSANLVLATDFDPPLYRHLHELVTVCGPTLHQIYRHCVGYPENPTVEQTIAYLTHHAVRAEAFYVGHPWRTVAQIKDEAELRDHLEEELDALDARGSLHGKTTAQIKQLLRATAEARPRAARVAFLPPELPNTTLTLFLSLTGWAVLGALFSWLLLPALVILLLKERGDARRDDPDGRLAREGARARKDFLVPDEDYATQNQMTHVSRVKPGWVRLLALRITLRLIGSLAQHYYNKGLLGGIPTIHFARWFLIDGGRRLVFFSNFDGSWESYLGDFIDKASYGLTAVWSNTVGFPPARALLFGGARAEEHFKNWTRAHQTRTEVWYAAYRRLSVRNVLDNTELRRGLWLPVSSQQEALDEEARWTRLL